MTRYLLDTDHVSLQERGHPPLRSRLEAIPPDWVGVSPVIVEEVLRGRLAILAARLDSEKRLRAYDKLVEAVRFFASIPVLPYDQACEEQFLRLRSLRLRVGSQDLRIAATALAHGLTVVTRNKRDFERVPGLTIEDWSEG